MSDIVETAPLTPDVGFLPSQPPRSARWIDGCREHWRPESSAVPGPQIGHNFTDAQRLCRTTRTPKYAHCFGNALSDRYLVLEPTLGRNIVALDDIKSWYALGVRDGRPRSRVDCPRAALLGCAARPAPPPRRRPLTCASRGRAVDGLLLAIGVPSYPSELASLRRNASRATWMAETAPQRQAAPVLACFVLSSMYDPATQRALEDEAARYGDMVFVDAPETSEIIRSGMKHSPGKKGRGLPTFKQFAFFEHAVRHWAGVAFVGKIDDDSLVNVRQLVPLLAPLRCRRRVFVGSMQWTAWVPQDWETGIRGSPCAQGSGLYDSLLTFDHERWRCDERGAVLPFPYGFGMGYIFSADLLRWVARDPGVRRWVEDARGPTREALQWQHYEDTTTGYWLSHAPMRVTYVSIARWSHDSGCHADGAKRRDEGHMSRPPSSASMLVHGLKRGGFEYAWKSAAGGVAYDHEECRRAAVEFS